MSKIHSQYVCQECGRISARKLGRCPTCGSWDTMVEEVVSEPASGGKKSSSSLAVTSKVQNLNEIESGGEERWPLDMQEFARVLGGGMVPGSIVLLGGDPGIGKSTLMLQVAVELAPSAWAAKARLFPNTFTW
jgi:DNA repair protein RadA/Sms